MDPDGGHGNFDFGQGQSDHVAALAAAGEVLEHDSAFEFAQRLLGKGRQNVSIGVMGDGCGLQPFAYDFGDLLHFQILWAASTATLRG